MRTQDRQIITDTTKRLIQGKRIKRLTGLYPLENLFYFVTMRCNAKCDHCFCWQDLNSGIAELSLEQVSQLAESVPPFRMLILTGGEPTLRKDILEVMSEFAKRSKTQVIRVNTNALFPDKLVQLARSFKDEFPYIGLDFQISIDGLQPTHDRIRGVPGNFAKAIESLKKIWELGKEYHSLTTNVLTVITDQNYKELLELNDYLREHVHPEVAHGMEIMRDVNKTAWNIPPEVREDDVSPKNMDLPPVESFPQILEDLCAISRRGSSRANAHLLHLAATLRMIETGRPQYPCISAGQSVGVIYSDGQVAHCEFTKPFASLADYNFDFQTLWTGPEANARRSQIRGCHCTHGCYQSKAIEMNWRGIAGMVRQSILS